VPTGSFSSSVGDGKLWHAHISSKHEYHLSTFIARHAPCRNKEIVSTRKRTSSTNLPKVKSKKKIPLF